jgi:hypothetical protein
MIKDIHIKSPKFVFLRHAIRRRYRLLVLSFPKSETSETAERRRFLCRPKGSLATAHRELLRLDELIAHRTPTHI